MKQKAIYIIGILVVLLVVSLKFYADSKPADEGPEQQNVSLSWNALSAGSFIYN